MDLNDLKQGITTLANQPITDRLSQLVDGWEYNNWMSFYVIFALIIGFIIGRRSAYSRNFGFQNFGEALLSHNVLANFAPPDYHLMNHITIQMSDGTTQIDHILVSRFGVFVIETKDYKGWIFGDSRSAKWMQVLFQDRFSFQNPIHQNFRHVQAVREILDFLPPDAIRSVVVFVGEAEFKTDPLDGVFSLPGFIDYVCKQTEEVMSENRLQFCVGRIETARLAISGETDIKHAQNLKRRYGRLLYNQ